MTWKPASGGGRATAPVRGRRHSTLGQRESGAGGQEQSQREGSTQRRKRSKPNVGLWKMDKIDKLLRRLIAKTRKKPTNSAGGEGHVRGDSRGCFLPVNLKIEMKWIILGKILELTQDKIENLENPIKEIESII